MSLSIEKNQNVFSGIFGWSGYWCTREKQFCSWILVYKCCVFDSAFDGGNRTRGGWELKVGISSELKINSTCLECLDCHESDAWIKTKGLLNKAFSANRNYSISELQWHRTHVLYETPTLQTWTQRVMGNFGRKKRRLLKWIFSFWKNFQRKITSCAISF